MNIIILMKRVVIKREAEERKCRCACAYVCVCVCPAANHLPLMEIQEISSVCLSIKYFALRRGDKERER